MTDKDHKKPSLASFQKLLAAILSVPKPELDKALAEEAAEKETEVEPATECEPE